MRADFWPSELYQNKALGLWGGTDPADTYPDFLLETYSEGESTYCSCGRGAFRGWGEEEKITGTGYTDTSEGLHCLEVWI